MENIPLVSVIIPTFNRFQYLLNAIDSVKKQTYVNIEIIVVNDNSSQPEYYTQKIENVNMIHLAKNSRDVMGFPCVAHVRNQGAKLAKGKYLAFLDDDDIFLPEKIQIQVEQLEKSHHCKMCSTDGYIGTGVYNAQTNYKLYNKEHHFRELCANYARRNFDLKTGFPLEWDKDFLEIHNCVITSSVLLSTDIFWKVGGFSQVRNGNEDYNLWLKCLDLTNILYIETPCFYYDENHGQGNQHHYK